MLVGIDFGAEHLEVPVAEENLIRGRRGPPAPAIQDVEAAVRQVLEDPLGFPPLRRALTPDDRVVIAIREELSHCVQLLTPIVEHLLAAGVDKKNVTVLHSPRWDGDDGHSGTGVTPVVPAAAGAGGTPALPETLQGVQTEIHDPTTRSKLAYLATTKAGRRIYLNRTLVDADQLVVLGRIGYDPVLGYAGGWGDVFPTLSDNATRAELAAKTTEAAPEAAPWPAELEAGEVGWLLGMPFLIQVVQGHGDAISYVLGGAADAVTREGRRRLDRHWRVAVERSADLVVAAISGDPGRQSFVDVVRAMACAARVVQPGGRIVVLSRAQAGFGPSAACMREAENAAEGLARVRKNRLPDADLAWQLARAADQAQLYLLSDIPPETVEELFSTPLENANQVRRLIDAAGSCLLLPDAHRTLAVVESPARSRGAHHARAKPSA